MTEAEIRDQYVQKAISYLGAVKGDSRHKQIIDTYNSYLPHPRGYVMNYYDNWCAAYESSIAIMCDLTDIIPVECSCNEQIALFQALGRWEENDAHVPSVGELLYYDWNDNGKSDDKNAAQHVGIVSSCDGKTMRVIEGNKGSQSVVGYRTVKVNARYIRGYAVPDFASKADDKPAPGYCTPSVPILTQGKLGEAVKAVQTLLNLRINARISVDGSFGPATKKAVISFQKVKGISPDGSVGPDTWTRLLNG